MPGQPRLGEQVGFGRRVMARYLEYVIGDARPFALEAKPGVVAQRHQFLLAEDDLDDGRPVGEFSQVSRFGVARTPARYAGCNSAPRGTGSFADRRVIIDDVHQRHAVEDDVERIVGVGQPGRVGDLECGRRITRTGARDHRFGIVDAGIAHAARNEIGEHFRIIAAAAADLEQAGRGDAGGRDGLRGDPEIEPRFAVLHVGNQAR